MPEDDLFYVGLENQVEFRRKLLESSKHLLNSLQSFQDLQRIRIEKYDRVIKLGKIIEEIRTLLTKLNKEFPETHLRPEIKAPRILEVPKITKPEQKPFSEPLDEINSLEQELSEIESQLSSLTQ